MEHVVTALSTAVGLFERVGGEVARGGTTVEYDSAYVTAIGELCGAIRSCADGIRAGDGETESRVGRIVERVEEKGLLLSSRFGSDDRQGAVAGVETANSCSETLETSVVEKKVVKPKHAGDNWQRNRDARAKKKANKKARQQAVGEVERESSGFWKSCPEEVRQQLIRSKAEMHIAENLRRAREDRKKVERMDSPEGYVVEALKMLRLASEIKKVDNDNKVAGWATVVANECAETIAKSVPSTAKSFEDFVASQGGISSRSSAPDVPLESKPEVVEKIVEVPVEKVVVKEKIVKVEVPVVKYVDKVKYVQIPPEGGRPKPSKDLSFGVTFKNPIERAVVAMGMIDDRQLLDARKNLGRELGYADFVGAEGKKKYKLTKNHVVQLMEVELQRVF